LIHGLAEWENLRSVCILNSEFIQMNFVAIDFETANEKRGSACSVGIVVVEGSEIVDKQHFFIKPLDMRFEKINVGIHGITPDAVSKSPVFGDLWSRLLPFFEHRVLVAHNASFDMSVLRYCMHDAAIVPPEIQYICSCNVSRAAWPELSSHRLPTLANYHGLDLEHHDALSDALVAAEVMLLAAKCLRVNSIDKVSHETGVSLGRITSCDKWVPSSAPKRRGGVDEFEIEIPEDYDISCHPLYGKNVVFTGELTRFTRKEAEKATEQVGGYPKSSVSKKTDYVVAGIQKPGKEYKKITRFKELTESGCDIELISDIDFTKMIFSPSAE
jgi:DNA polymerase-3 subunit epsilon